MASAAPAWINPPGHFAKARAEFGSTIDEMPIEQYLLLNFGRADDLIAADTITGHLALLGMPNGLALSRKNGKSYIDSTKVFEDRYGIRVKVRLLQ